jgi:hypothetical protein
VLPASQQRILESLPDDALVLDIGGWASPFGRADWVLDLMPYETRGQYAWSDRDESPRFTKDTWVQRDICDKQPYPFEDNQFDFVVCAQTLEDVRDPLWVCSEMQRIGKAGYIEVPSRLSEQTMWVQGPWVGHSHHHWLIDIGERSISFIFKPTMLAHERFHFPANFKHLLSAEEREATLWWEGGFDFEERFLFGEGELERYLEDFVNEQMAARGATRPSAPEPGLVHRIAARGRAALARR